MRPGRKILLFVCLILMVIPKAKLHKNRKAIVRCCGKIKCSDWYIRPKNSSKVIKQLKTHTTQQGISHIPSTIKVSKEDTNDKTSDQIPTGESLVDTGQITNADSPQATTLFNDEAIEISTLKPAEVSGGYDEVATFVVSNPSTIVQGGTTAPGQLAQEISTSVSNGTTKSNASLSSTESPVATTTVQFPSTTTPNYTTTTMSVTSATATSGAITLTPSTQTLLSTSIKTFETPTTLTSTTLTTTTSTTTTSTTTTPSLCKDPCTSYNNITSMSFAKAAVPLGSFLVLGNKMFYKSDSIKLSLMEAVQACAKLNMSLLSAFDPKIVDPLMKAIGASTTDLLFWTSGANEGQYCDLEKIYSWCSVGKRFYSTDLAVPWADAAKVPRTFERCLMLKRKPDEAFGIDFANCATSSASVLCEPACPRSSCPTSCVSNQSLFNENKILNDANNMGFWAKDVCGSNYLFSNKLGNWEQNYKTCCSIGMTPIVFETKTEFDCLSAWKYNFNYWTGGTQTGCKGVWSWCLGTDDVPFPNNLTWAYEQPDNRNGSDDCVQMRLLQNETGIAFSDRACSDKYVIACEGTPKLRSCFKPNCLNISRGKNESLFSGEDLQDFFGYGTWLSGCGRVFLFANKKLSWAKAQRKCFEIGTNLLAVEYDDKDTCISRLVKQYKKLQGIEFWTTGSDFECKGSHYWCAINRTITNRNMVWGSSTDGDCISVNYGNSSVFSKVPCSTSQYYVCEVRQEGTFAQALQKECMDVWNVTLTDLIIFDATYDALTVERKLKCFFKCIGENLEMFTLGGLSPSGDLLRKIEEIAGDDDDKIQNSFQAYDGCGAKTTADECESAAEIYQCGRNADSAIVDQIYNQAKGDNAVSRPPTPCIATSFRSCRMGDLPCVKNITLANELVTTNYSVEIDGQLIFDDKGYKLFATRKAISVTKAYAHEFCCSLGMRLPSFETQEEVAEYRSLYNSHIGIHSLAFMAEAYANGDGTDSWCSTGALVNTSIYSDGIYPSPTCNYPTAPIINLVSNQFAIIITPNAEPYEVLTCILLCQ